MFAPAQTGGSSRMMVSVAVGEGARVGDVVGVRIGGAAGAQPTMRNTEVIHSVITTGLRLRMWEAPGNVFPCISHLFSARTLPQ